MQRLYGNQPTHRDHSCNPRELPALADHVFRNDGGRRRRDRRPASSIRDGRGLGVVAADLDDDGKVDLFVANDTTSNNFSRNRAASGSRRGLEAGLATNASGGYLAGWAWPAATSTATAGSTWP